MLSGADLMMAAVDCVDRQIARIDNVRTDPDVVALAAEHACHPYYVKFMLSVGIKPALADSMARDLEEGDADGTKVLEYRRYHRFDKK